MDKLAERSTQPLTRPWQAGREDSAGDNETCSRPPIDLRGSPAVCASLKGAQRIVKFVGRSRNSEMNELSPQGGSEGYGACDGEAAVWRNYDSRGHRRPGMFPAPGMRGKYGAFRYNEGAAQPGPFCLATAQISPVWRPLSFTNRNGIVPPLLLAIQARGGGRSKGGERPAAL